MTDSVMVRDKKNASCRHNFKSVPALAVAASLVLMMACADQEPQAPDGNVDLGPGESREEQIEEISVVVGLLEDHIGDGLILRSDSTDVWSPEHHAENRRPTADCSGEDEYRNEVFFTHPEIDVDEAYSAAERIGEELGFAPNGEVNRQGEDSAQGMMYAARAEDGRVFVVREAPSEEENVQIIYKTRCTEHASNHEAIEEFREDAREERRRERAVQ